MVTSNRKAQSQMAEIELDDSKTETDFLIIEKRLRQKLPRSRCIATRLTRICEAPADTKAITVVVVDRPAAIMPAVKRRWFVIISKLRTERAGTLTHAKIILLTRQIEMMQELRFVVGIPQVGMMESCVFFVEPREFEQVVLH